MTRVLRNGLLSGLVAGVSLAVYMLVFGRGPIRAALDYEDELADSAGDGAAHDELFSRGVQELGGAIGLLIFGVALGLIFAVVLAAVAPRMGPVTPLRASLQLGLVGFIVVVIVPFLKYPANPPAVGDPDTINERTLAYFSVLAASIVLANVVWRVVEASRRSPVGRAWLGAGLYAGGLVIIFVVFPAPADAVTAPTDLVWDFRLASLGGLATAWAALSLTMGTLLTRQVERDSGRQPVSVESSP
ncbi:MAG: CbtA family protein [Acidimicrobiia bacterium]|nr:CbtA family protein [Acidimicrobiia bacterium]